MSHSIYNTDAIVLRRLDTAEADITLWLLTEDLGLIVARATGARKGTSKMRNHLQTFATVSVSLVRGRYMWRLVGAESLGEDITNGLKSGNLVVFANIANFIIRMTISSSSVSLYVLLNKIRHNILTAEGSEELYRIEVLAMARVLIELGYIPSDVLSSGSINIKELVTDINKATNESHL